MNEDVFNSFPELKTERLHLIRHELEHAEDMFELRTDPDVMKYMDANPPDNIQFVKDKITEIRADFDQNKGIAWVLKLKDTSEVIGYCSFWKIDKSNNRAEIGYAIKKKHWRKGLLFEACKVLINYGFETMALNTVIANTNIDNAGSQGLLTKLGFRKEAHFRQDYYFNGVYLDSAIYGLIQDEWIF